VDCLPVNVSVAIVASARAFIALPGKSSIELGELDVLLQNEPILDWTPSFSNGFIASKPFQRPPISSEPLMLNTFIKISRPKDSL
jgi:hypothetical protein